MKLKRAIASGLMAALLVSGCLMTQGCSVDQMKKAVGDMIITANAGAQIIDELQSEGVLPAERASTIKSKVVGIRTALQNFLARLDTYKEFNPASKADLARIFADVTSTLGEIQGLDLFSIKDEKLRQRVRLLISSFAIAARMIEQRLK
jgi:hypothetical protein